jgi:NAD+ kinase
MNLPRIALAASPAEAAQKAAQTLRESYDFVDQRGADLVVALGGDGFMLEVLHEMLDVHRPIPVFGMNLGTVGFLMNEYRTDRLIDRLQRARSVSFHPLEMEAHTIDGARVIGAAINEVSLLRETRQTAKLQIAIDGRVRLQELICDGVLVATPPGSTAYNLSAHGPILPLESSLLALTPISPFRPRRWRGALIPDTATIEFRILDAAKRPVSAVADQREVRDVSRVTVATNRATRLTLLFDPDQALDDRIVAEQFAS